MTNANTFTCPTCGAALQTNGTELEVKCEYCGNVVVVPDSLRTSNSQQVPFQAYYAPPQPVIIIDPSSGQTNFQSSQMQQGKPVVLSRRRNGCGCFGCLSFIAVLLIIALIALGIFVAVAPGQINQVLTQVNGAVKPALADIGIFSVDPSQVSNNGVVTFRWAVNLADSSATINIDRIANGNTVTVLRGLPSVGNYTLTVQGKPGDKITFKLISTRNGVSTDKSVIVTIK